MYSRDFRIYPNWGWQGSTREYSILGMGNAGESGVHNQITLLEV
jgi:hypothetical protein